MNPECNEPLPPGSRKSKRFHSTSCYKRWWHGSGRPRPCKKCGESGMTPSALSGHEPACDGVGAACPKCGQRFDGRLRFDDRKAHQAKCQRHCVICRESFSNGRYASQATCGSKACTRALDNLSRSVGTGKQMVLPGDVRWWSDDRTCSAEGCPNPGHGFASGLCKTHENHRRGFTKPFQPADPHETRERIRESVRRRRAKRRGATIGQFGFQDLELRTKQWGEACWMCGGPNEEIDHVKPLSVGGAHALSNLRPSCQACNRRKWADWPIDLSEWRRPLLDPARLP